MVNPKFVQFHKDMRALAHKLARAQGMYPKEKATSEAPSKGEQKAKDDKLDG